MEQGDRDSYDQVVSSVVGRGRQMTSMIVGAKGGRTESQEEILTPRNRVLVRQDVVSWTSFFLLLCSFEIVGR